MCELCSHRVKKLKTDVDRPVISASPIALSASAEIIEDLLTALKCWALLQSPTLQSGFLCCFALINKHLILGSNLEAAGISDRGRPRMAWRAWLDRDMKDMGPRLGMAMDQEKWRCGIMGRTPDPHKRENNGR